LTQIVAIVGGAGFIGTELYRRLSNAGIHARILDKRRVALEDAQVVDVTDLSSLVTGLNGTQAIINLAAEHKDNVIPRSLYFDVNVQGARNVCDAARRNGIQRIVFTSSVAVYGFAPSETDETGRLNPFNDYGRTKMQAEVIYRQWLSEDSNRSLTIVRPTVVFGRRNRGNVYRLLKQIASGTFIMVGSGCNKKSMAYVENVAAFLEFSLGFGAGEHLFNYVDKPDRDMNTLVIDVRRILGAKQTARLRLPYWVGYAGGIVLDFAARITRREFPISAIRVKKFCAQTLYSSSRIKTTGFKPPVTMAGGLEKTLRYEFVEKHNEDLFYSE
jgi:nucleoside-diphosphate-sugar epimerase